MSDREEIDRLTAALSRAEGERDRARDLVFGSTGLVAGDKLIAERDSLRSELQRVMDSVQLVPDAEAAYVRGFELRAEKAEAQLTEVREERDEAIRAHDALAAWCREKDIVIKDADSREADLRAQLAEARAGIDRERDALRARAESAERQLVEARGECGRLQANEAARVAWRAKQWRQPYGHGFPEASSATMEVDDAQQYIEDMLDDIGRGTGPGKVG